jgi:hypothetical protein
MDAGYWQKSLSEKSLGDSCPEARILETLLADFA